MNIKNLVKNNNQATFVYYRQGLAYYSVKDQEDNQSYIFPVDTKDLGDATLNATEKAIMLMRYIRQAIEAESIAKFQDEREGDICMPVG